MISQEEQDAIGQWVQIDSVKPYKGNARIGDVDTLRESLRTNGQYKPLVVRQKTSEILVGNNTWQAAKLEGWDKIWVLYTDCDAKTARRINLVDNRTSDLATWDTEALIAQLVGTELIGTGFTQTDVDRLTASLIISTRGDTDPEAPAGQPRTHRGDLWTLGAHRLLCGDATSRNDVLQLCGQENPVCMWTDPPYLGPDDNSSHNETALPELVEHVANSLRQLLSESFSLADEVLARGASVYLLHPGGANSIHFLNAFVEHWHLRQNLVWLKEGPMMGPHDYKMMHELIAYGHTKGRPADRGWYGGQDVRSVLQFDRPRQKLTKVHKQTRPVGLVESCVVNSTPKGGVVYEPFAGSGSTIIACENINRRCLAMELDPGYCDVIVDRWQRHTGLSGTVERRDGRSA